MNTARPTPRPTTPANQATPSDLGWAAQALCANTDRGLFFIDGRGRGAQAHIARALALCTRCPVRQACLDHAQRTPERFGVWGGTTARQRGWDPIGQPGTHPQPTQATQAAQATRAVA